MNTLFYTILVRDSQWKVWQATQASQSPELRGGVHSLSSSIHVVTAPAPAEPLVGARPPSSNNPGPGPWAWHVWLFSLFWPPLWLWVSSWYVASHSSGRPSSNKPAGLEKKGENLTITRLPRGCEHETKDHYDSNETDDMYSLLLELAFGINNCFGQDLQVSQLYSKNSASDHDFGIITERHSSRAWPRTGST